MSNLTLYLDPTGFAELADENDEVIWTSQEEDDKEFLEQFGDVIDESEMDDLADWLQDAGIIQDGETVSICLEYLDDETDCKLH